MYVPHCVGVCLVAHMSAPQQRREYNRTMHTVGTPAPPSCAAMHRASGGLRSVLSCGVASKNLGAGLAAAASAQLGSAAIRGSIGPPALHKSASRRARGPFRPLAAAAIGEAFTITTPLYYVNAGENTIACTASITCLHAAACFHLPPACSCFGVPHSALDCMHATVLAGLHACSCR